MQLNETFETVAELYDRARPRYPAALFADLHALAGLTNGSRVLEIAPGTGVAVTAGTDPVDGGRLFSADSPWNTTAEGAPAEDYPLEAASFDLVCCATAFSWLDPAVRVDKSALALRPGGFLGVWDTHHVAGGTGQFFVDSQECYERWMPGTEPCALMNWPLFGGR